LSWRPRNEFRSRRGPDAASKTAEGGRDRPNKEAPVNLAAAVESAGTGSIPTTFGTWRPGVQVPPSRLKRKASDQGKRDCSRSRVYIRVHFPTGNRRPFRDQSVQLAGHAGPLQPLETFRAADPSSTASTASMRNASALSASTTSAIPPCRCSSTKPACAQDVQRLVGHADLKTTQAIVPSTTSPRTRLLLRLTPFLVPSSLRWKNHRPEGREPIPIRRWCP
jgi:hypothetical protein